MTKRDERKPTKDEEIRQLENQMDIADLHGDDSHFFEAARKHTKACAERDERKPTIDEENTILSVGREFLPACALAVLDGGPATPAYDAWIAGQLEQMDSEQEGGL